MNNLSLQIFKSFFKIGAFTIGGGYAMLCLIEDEIVNKKKWLTQDEFLEGMAIAQATPGALAVNISVITGYKIKGYKGMFMGVLGSILPSFLIVLLLSKFLFIYKDTPIFIAFFNGLKPGVIALIFLSVYRIGKLANLYKYAYLIPVIVAIIIRLRLISPIIIILLTIIIGNVYFAIKEAKKTEEGDVE